MSNQTQLQQNEQKSKILYETLRSIMQVGFKGLNLKEKLQEIIEIILKVPHLKVENKGGIFLNASIFTDIYKEETLELYVEKNLGEKINSLCSSISFGQCLCGKAALSKKLIYKSCIDDDHEITFEGIKPHGHYNAPILNAKGRVKGVLVLYLSHNYKPVKEEIEFIKSISEGISIIIQAHIKEEKLEKALNEKEEALLIKGDFLANMSHEIRTPMNAIIGFTELLDATTIDDEQKEYLDSIQIAGQNLLTIINDILDYAKIESGQLTFNKEPFFINKILNHAKKTLTALADKKGIALEFHKDSRVKDRVLGDQGRLNQVFINLIGNAIKFTNRGKVEVSTSLINETNEFYEIKFSIKDTGIGIPSDKLEEIFTRFQQAEKYTTRKYGGTGLGLSISKKIVETLKGNLEVVSEEGEGSEFFFSLNFAKSKLETKSLPVLKSSDFQHLFGINILLIEDNPMNQLLAQKILDKMGVNIIVATDGKEGIKEFESSAKKIDIILMDIQMPVMNGYEATKYIRNTLNSTTPIIAMTAHSMVGEKKKCTDLGMNEYISKPYTRNELLTVIGKFVGKD